MATTGIDTWAVDLADVGAIYPFQGWETLMLIIGLVTWIGWHIWCAKWEKGQYAENIAKYGDTDTVKQAIDSD